MIAALIGAFLHFTSNNPVVLVQGASAAKAAVSAQRHVDTSQFSGFADMTREILKCYHPTARYLSADVAQSPWSRGEQYQAAKSSLLVIRFSGLTNQTYEMQVGVVERQGSIRTAVISETAKIRASNRCELESWTPIGGK